MLKEIGFGSLMPMMNCCQKLYGTLREQLKKIYQLGLFVLLSIAEFKEKYLWLIVIRKRLLMIRSKSIAWGIFYQEQVLLFVKVNNANSFCLMRGYEDLKNCSARKFLGFTIDTWDNDFKLRVEEVHDKKDLAKYKKYFQKVK